MKKLSFKKHKSKRGVSFRAQDHHYSDMTSLEDDQQNMRNLIAHLSTLIEKMPKSDDSSDNNCTVERDQVRLDGIEVYAMIAALNLASSIACLDAFGPVTSFSEAKCITDIIIQACFFISNITGILAGTHATLIFSMVTMYGRTAIGLNRDDALHTFLSDSGKERLKGFKSFSLSLYSFLVQFLFVTVNHVTPWGLPMKVLVFMIVGYTVWVIARETRNVMKQGSKMFRRDSFRTPPKRQLSIGRSATVRDVFNPQNLLYSALGRSEKVTGLDSRGSLMIRQDTEESLDSQGSGIGRESFLPASQCDLNVDGSPNNVSDSSHSTFGMESSLSKRSSDAKGRTKFRPMKSILKNRVNRRDVTFSVSSEEM